MTPALSVQSVEKAFGGVRAVDGVSVDVAPGEIVALIGPNGAGKSTLFNILGGQIAPDAGRVLTFGEDATGRAPRRLARGGVGRTFQIARVFPTMTALQNVQTALIARDRAAFRVWGRADRHRRSEALAALSEVGLADQADVQASSLSYGDLKRLELAAVLSQAPKILLLDEPTAGLPAAESASMMALVRRAAAERGAAALFTEHDMTVVFDTAERVLVLDRGRLIADAAPAAVRADPTVRAVYLGEEEGS